ncbi:MAG: hypothetical protein ACK4UJ_10110 [Leptonema sp. (in: bacteria)]
MKSKNISFLLLLIVLYCSQNYKEKRREWAIQYRNQIQQNFQGFSSIEDLIQNFLKDMISGQDVGSYFLSKDEYLKIYWANEDWERIYDKGMTLENAWNVYELIYTKNKIKWSNHLKNKKIEFLSYDVENIKDLGSSKIYKIHKIRIKENQKEFDLFLVKYIIQHNEKFKILSLYEL